MKKIFFILYFLITSINSQIVIEELGRFGGTGTEKGKLNNPSAIDITDENRVLVCDRRNNRIQIFDEKGFFVKDIGGFGSKSDQFDEPMDIWARSTLNIFVADYNNQRVQRFDRKLNFINAFYSNEGEDERFQFQEVISVAHSSQGDLFILEAGENKVIKFQRENAQISFGFFDSGAGELYDPKQIDITPDQKIIISDAGNGCINKYDYFGNFLTNLTTDKMQSPTGLCVDKTGRIYITDTGSKKVFIISSKGELLNTIEMIGGKKIDYPADIAVRYNENNIYTAYLIDRDEVIILTLKFD